MPNVSKGWLKDRDGKLSSPNTFVDQIYNNDGTPFVMPEGVEVVDDLTSDAPDQALSARQGKVLDEKTDILSAAIIRKYTKPTDGIPKTDLAQAVQKSLDKADTALQSYTEKYTGTITEIKMNGTSKGTSGVVDLGTVITDVSGKLDKASFLTATDIDRIWDSI